MKTYRSWVFLSTTFLTGAVVVASGISGCRSSTNGFGPTSASSAVSSSGSSSGGTGGSTSSPIVTIEQITDSSSPKHVGPGTAVTIKGAVAMSIKFLVEHSKSSNTCIWGAFISAPGVSTATANTGLLIVNDGTMAVGVDGGEAYCPVLQAGQPAGDALPDDLQPGDVLDLSGTTDAYVPSTCSAADAGAGYSDVPAIQLTKLTSAVRTSRGAATPAPYVMTSSDLTTLAAGKDTTWLSNYGGVYVQANDVTAISQEGELTDAYGNMLLGIGTYGVEVGDGLYYVGDVRATDVCYGNPYYPTVPPTSLNYVRGFVYLNYCNWSLAPRDKCEDLSPPSADCVQAFDAGTDASPSAVCYHEPVGLSDGGS